MTDYYNHYIAKYTTATTWNIDTRDDAYYRMYIAQQQQAQQQGVCVRGINGTK